MTMRFDHWHQIVHGFRIGNHSNNENQILWQKKFNMS